MGRTRKSAGILLYRQGDQTEYFLVHPGGPFWAKKDLGAWSIPKGEFDDEEPAAAAVREFMEETGVEVKVALFFLGTAKQKSGKTIYAFAAMQDLDETRIRSNTFPLQWPPGSGRSIMVPEVDRGGWFKFTEACGKINPGQRIFLERLRDHLG